MSDLSPNHDTRTPILDVLGVLLIAGTLVAGVVLLRLWVTTW